MRAMTVSEIIDALGGTSAVAGKLGVTATRVSNWRTFGRFPDRVSLHDQLKTLCDEAGIALDVALFEKASTAA